MGQTHIQVSDFIGDFMEPAEISLEAGLNIFWQEILKLSQGGPDTPICYSKIMQVKGILAFNTSVKMSLDGLELSQEYFPGDFKDSYVFH
jgi:hypothetical protein